MFRDLWIAIQQWGINLISDFVFRLKKAETKRLCRQYNCKYYLVQSGYFRWTILRARDIDYYKARGEIKKEVRSIDLHKIAAFVAYPDRTVSVSKLKGGKK